jgi:hypothetical protein
MHIIMIQGVNYFLICVLLSFISTGKIKKKSCTNLGKRRILGELPCDSRQLTEDVVITAKKSLAFNQEKKTNAGLIQRLSDNL